MTKALNAAQMNHEIFKLKANDIATLARARADMPKTGNHHASAVIVTIQALDGKLLVPPFTVNDGLSPESITALKADVQRTIDERLRHAGAFKP